jgi:hypothetical protein
MFRGCRFTPETRERLFNPRGIFSNVEKGRRHRFDNKAVMVVVILFFGFFFVTLILVSDPVEETAENRANVLPAAVTPVRWKRAKRKS